MSSKFFLSLGLIFSFLIVFSNTSPSFAADNGGKHTVVRLLPEKTTLKGGETVTIGIEHEIEPGWHIYWLNPGDSGIAPRIQWKNPDIKAAPIQWPTPKKLPLGPLTNFGYEGNVVLLQDITLPEKLPDGPLKISATLDLLVCHEICIPESHEVSFFINDGPDNDDENYYATNAIERARTFLPLDMGWATTMAEADGDLIVTVNSDTPSAFTNLKSIDLFPEEWGLILNTQKTRTDKKVSTLTLHHARGDRALADVPVSKLVIAYDDAQGQRKAVRVSTLAGAGDPAASANIGFIEAILFALLGGIILNLMPCVFPVLSMKALSLAQMKDKEIGIARKHGIAYTLGILACFALIAGILIALKAGGAQIGWGFQLQHPSITLFLAYLFFVLGLNLSGYFDIDLGLSNAGQKLTAHSSLSGSFFTGALATLVATPCTAPFMGVAMGYALIQPYYIAITIFLALGFGLAFPYLALTFIPAVRHILPKPGAWMERLRQFLAFPMFASACWLIWVLSQQISHMGQFAALLGMLAIAFGIWLWKYRPAHIAGHLFYTTVVIACLAFVISTFFTMRPIENNPATEIEKSQNWEDFSQTKLQEYLQDDDPVFVNMTAAWCITCKVNEKVALNTENTRALFAANKIKYLKGDWTNQNPEITAFLEEYDRSGVPLYVYYGPRLEKHGVRPEPVVLPQILTPGLVENAITSKGD